MCGVITLSQNSITYGQAQMGSFIGEDFMLLPSQTIETYKFQDTAEVLDTAFVLEISFSNYQEIKNTLIGLGNTRCLKNLQALIKQSYVNKLSWKKFIHKANKSLL